MKATVKIVFQVYQKPDSPFAIFKAEIVDEVEGALPFESQIGIKGPLSGLEEGDVVEVEGRLGRFQGRPEIQVEAYRLALPKSDRGMVAWLSRYPGVGPKSAKRIVETFGPEKTNELLLGDPLELGVALRAVPKLSAKAIRGLVEAAKADGPERELSIYLAGLGMTAGTIKSVIRTLGVEAPALVRGDPYVLTRVQGIGFLRADAFALETGLALDDPRRLRASVLHLLEESEDDGHSFLRREDLIGRALAWLSKAEGGVEVGEAQLSQAIEDLIEARRVREEEGAIYSLKLWIAETETVAQIERLLGLGELGVQVPTVAEAEVRLGLSAYEKETGIELSEDQRAAVLGMISEPVACLLGGPGTGKTTITRALLSVFKRASLRIGLLAPTGKAAHRQGEVCQKEASTIHRALGLDPKTGGFVANEEAPLECDVLFVDESSMIHLILAYGLLRAIRSGARVYLIGDTDQLDPVGPGSFFSDLIASEAVPVFRLTKIHRQAEGSEIIRGAYQANRGQLPDARDARYLDMTPGRVWLAPFVGRDGVDDPDRVVRWALGRLRKLGAGPGDVQILTPQKKGKAGTIALNLTLQAWANPDGEEAIRGLRVGDRVINGKNLYGLGVFNGDTGILVATGSQPARKKDGTVKRDRRTGEALDERFVEVDFLDGRIVRYGEEDSVHLDLAYAVSIHKAQGSEARIVFLLLHRSHYRMLSRAIIYTGMTRAKEILVLFGSTQSLALAVRDTGGIERNSRLARRLAEIQKEPRP